MQENLNMNLNEKKTINTLDLSWQPSPISGVERKPLERENKESGHTTSIVRYKPGSKFSAHSHPKGEEIFVLEGVFSDETGDYPAGSYLRNPPGSSHAPFSKEGCIIFVKLHQFKPLDNKVVRIKTKEAPWLPGQGRLKVMPLHSFETESVALVKWPAGEKFTPHKHWGGEEIFVLSGVFKDEYGNYSEGTWLRSPHLSSHFPYVDEETIILVKTGHLLKEENYE